PPSAFARTRLAASGSYVPTSPAKPFAAPDPHPEARTKGNPNNRQTPAARSDIMWMDARRRRDPCVAVDHPKRREGGTMPTRPQLARGFVAPGALAGMESFHAEIVREVQDAVGREPVVVVGMAQNPHVRKVCRALDEAGVRHKYLEYGSYFAGWKERLAIKLWSGWPTFPQVFVRGILIGGEDLTKKALADGSLKSSLKAATPAAAVSA
ncbi:MAG: hypothetical protein ACRENE_34735, partial [Polyangiaceae bacterium]